MLRVCRHPSCTTRTLGEYCLLHESPPPRRRQAASFDGCHREHDRFPEEVAAAYGFRVISPAGSLGHVDGHSYVGDRLTGLVIRPGRFGRRRLRLPLEEIDWVLPTARIIVVQSDTQLSRETS